MGLNLIPKVAIFGTGYVGLVTGVCIADFGINVICVDIDKEKIDGLNNGKIPIYEPDLMFFLLKINAPSHVQTL